MPFPPEIEKLKPEGTTEYEIELHDQVITVWEFSFRKVKELNGHNLKDLAGRCFKHHNLIWLNADDPLYKRKWTLDHELAHLIRYMDGSDLEEVMWDELECELMVVGKISVEDFAHPEILSALKSYLRSGRSVQERARMLVNWLRERTSDEKEEGPREPVGLPETALRGRFWGSSDAD